MGDYEDRMTDLLVGVAVLGAILGASLIAAIWAFWKLLDHN